MKLLFDENLSADLVATLADFYPGSVHVRDCGLKSAADEAVWKYAKERGFAIVSKDSDFQEKSIVQGSPPKIICLKVANCSTHEIEKLLRAAKPLVDRFIAEDQESCLILAPRAKT